MILSHFGVALLLKAFAPFTSLGTLVFASYLPDLLWLCFLLCGLEQAQVCLPNNLHRNDGVGGCGGTAPKTIFTNETALVLSHALPEEDFKEWAGRIQPVQFLDVRYSHSFFALLLWACVFAVLYYLTSTNKYTRGSIAVFVAVLSHWVLDVLFQRSDIPFSLSKDSEAMGWGLLDSLLVVLLVELTVLMMGTLSYLSHTTPMSKIGQQSFWALIFVLCSAFLCSVFISPMVTIFHADLFVWASVTLPSFIGFILLSTFVDSTRAFLWVSSSS
ncbi:hypothetical protein QOT17_002251 [Balamuthia mandrillaris]